jgi:hypothetical protein
MQVDYYSIAFEIKHSNTEKNWDCAYVKVLDVLVQFRVVYLVLEAVLEDHEH